MPYRKYKKKRYTKKRRRYGGKSKQSWLKKSGSGLVKSNPLPKTFKFNAHYADTIAINPGIGGVMQTHVFSANGLYDPDISGVGHQPLGYDELMTMYDHYTVIGSRIKVTATNTDATVSQRVLVHLRDKDTVTTNVTELIENGLNRWTTLNAYGEAGSTKVVTLNCNPSIFLGQKVRQSSACKGTQVSNPPEQCYFHVSIDPVQDADTDNVRCLVEIEYIAILTEPKTLGQS